MTDAPATGERSALRGYRWQYDHIAARVYDALLDNDLVSVRLTDPMAERVDDLVLVRHYKVDAYQFKSADFERNLTFNQIISSRRSRSGRSLPSLVESLASGWSALRTQWNNVSVHLVTQHVASVHDHLGGGHGVERPSPDHCSAFLRQVLQPIRASQIGLDDVDEGWQHALTRLREATGLSNEHHEDFLRSLQIDVGAGSGLPATPSPRHSDIVDLSSALQRTVSLSSKVVVLDADEVLRLMGWEGRPRLRSHHEFPVDLDTYEPLSEAMELLGASVDRYNSGYLAVLGPPGSGKSSLLSQVLSGSDDRIVRYFAYVPGSAPAQSRLTSRSFLHDLVVMLGAERNGRTARELPSADVEKLRGQFTDQLDEAASNFRRTRRRTIIVVDGLDHVDRDYSGNDGLLNELPRPSETPEGVLFLVGSRTLAPLHAYARQQLLERQATIDLQHHRLSPGSVLRICRRVSVTANLPAEVHENIVELSDGHPLALSYILNRLRDTESETAEDVLRGLPAYGGDVAAEYRAVWDEVQDSEDIVEILAVCSRLRTAFTTDWLLEWASYAAVDGFRRKVLYLFRRHNDGWRFFHDSFRQFVVDCTAWGDESAPHAGVDARIHERIADICANSQHRTEQDEQLYHLWKAGRHDAVVSLAQQRMFREQFKRLRSPELIREDIGLALNAASCRGDVPVIVRLLLALAETWERSAALEDVDVSSVLYDAGLIDEAIAWCGVEAPRVPLAEAYELSARLGTRGDPGGRRLFDLIEHRGFGNGGRRGIGGHEGTEAVSWTRAAVLFRPPATIIRRIRAAVGRLQDDGTNDRWEYSERWNRYESMILELINAAVRRHDEEALKLISRALADDFAQVEKGGTQTTSADENKRDDEATARKRALIAGLRIRSEAALTEMVATAELAEHRLKTLLRSLSGVPLFAHDRLDVAELCARHAIRDQAAAFLANSPYSQPLTVRNLGHGGEADAIDSRFRYWRLHRFLTPEYGDALDADAASECGPAREKKSEEAAVDRDTAAIELAARVDLAVKKLARLDARIASGEDVSGYDARTIVTSALFVYPTPAGRQSATYRGIAQTKSQLMRIAVEVACNYGDDCPEQVLIRLEEAMATHPDEWPLSIRLQLSDTLRSAGIHVPWYRETVAALETHAATESVSERLDDVASLARRHARDGEKERAQMHARSLIPLAFGIGYRKDYQFNAWASWLGRALTEPSGDEMIPEAVWLARLLTASDEMSEEASALAATDLPAAIVPACPISAVRVFEHLVRHGTVQHLDAMASLLQALVRELRAGQSPAVTLVVNMTADMIAPASNHACEELASAVLAKHLEVSSSEKTDRLAESLARRTDKYALPTTRSKWRRGWGLGGAGDDTEETRDRWSDESDIGALVLTDGTSVARGDVLARAKSVADIVTLHRSESDRSFFDWSAILAEREFDDGEILELWDAIDGVSHRTQDARVLLAEKAESNGSREMALRFADDILESASGDSWSPYHGGMRWRAANIVLRLGDADARTRVCHNLTSALAESAYLPSILLPELEKVVGVLDSGLSARTVWPDIRTYLEGMAETLALPDEDLLGDLRCRWWSPETPREWRLASEESTASAAVAELLVAHLSHPARVLRHAATKLIAQALGGGSKEVAGALVRLAQPEVADDVLEGVGRCLAAARSRYAYQASEETEPLVHLLENHGSQVVRSLVSDQTPRGYRVLSPMYRWTLPDPSREVIGSEGVMLEPHVKDYELLADALDLQADTLMSIATRYASEQRARLPKTETMRKALQASGVKHTYIPYEVEASRAAYGRVVAEVMDAHLLDDVAPNLRRRVLRTSDVDVLTRTPRCRPRAIAAPPQAGLGHTIERWRSEIERRLDEYIREGTGEGWTLVGAIARCAVLNWAHLEEEFLCGTTVGTSPPQSGRGLAYLDSVVLGDLTRAQGRDVLDDGAPLVFANVGARFCQVGANWMAFRPDVAVGLAWTPDPNQAGCWMTSDGDVAVEAIWWVDGWWGRAGPAFNDTQADGHAVILTSAGRSELMNKIGAMTHHYKLVRRGLDDGMEVDAVTASRAISIIANSTCREV